VDEVVADPTDETKAGASNEPKADPTDETKARASNDPKADATDETKDTARHEVAKQIQGEAKGAVQRDRPSCSAPITAAGCTGCAPRDRNAVATPSRAA
jgi:hypothetical protein